MADSDGKVLTFKQKYNTKITWQEKAVLISLYHTAMCLRYPDWNMNDTAQHFEVSLGLVSENIRLAKEMDGGLKAKQLLECKTREEGLKLIERRRYPRQRNNNPLFKLGIEE